MGVMAASARPARPARSPRAARTRVTHSLEAVVGAAVALLDEAGEGALTFRALAERLGGGVGSIYWYVASKDELLDRACDHVLADVLERTAGVGGAADPVDDVRTLAVALFDAIVDRPWLGSYLMRDTDVQPNALAYFERLGQQVLRLDLSARETFHATSSVLGFVVGTAADLGQHLPSEVADGTMTREEYTARYAERWRSLDAERFPFLHAVAEEFAHHDDAEQFRAGLDLMLVGLRQQADRRGR